MTSVKRNNIKLGLFVSIAFLVLSASLYFIGSKQNLFGSTFALRTVFKDVNGLSPGNNVRYAGINVGTVKELVFLNDSTIEVNMIIQEKIQSFIKQDAMAQIGSDGLVGNMIVKISPGKGLAAHVNDNDLIQSFVNMEAGEIMNNLGSTTDYIALLVNNLLEISEQLNKGDGSLAMLIKDETLAHDLQSTVHHLKQSSQDINKISSSIRANIESSVNGDRGLLGYLLHDTTFKGQISHITEGLDTLVRQRTEPILVNMRLASNELALATKRANDLLNQINFDQGLSHTILKDSMAQLDLEQAIHNLDQGLFRFNETMEALQHNFLVRNYFKKQEKREKKKKKND